MSEFQRMTDIGNVYGVSSHVIGKWLVECGLRTPDKTRPSKRAFDGGYVWESALEHGGTFYLWHTTKTIAALKAAGHEIPGQEHHPSQPANSQTGTVAPNLPTLSNKFKGPFTRVKASQSVYLIHNADGTATVWVKGDEASALLLAIMNDNRERLEGE